MLGLNADFGGIQSVAVSNGVVAVAIENREDVSIGDAANPGHRQRTVLVLEVTLAAFAVHPEGHMRMIAVWPIAEI